MNTYEAILKRRSVRSFSNEQVTDEEIDLLLKSAMAAPSACNKQPWEFYVIKDEKVRNDLSSMNRSKTFIAPLSILVCANTNKSLTTNIDDFWIQDLSAAVENILLCAVELHLSTCWMGVYPVKERVEGIKNYLHLPNNIVPFALIQVGHALVDPEPRTQFDEKLVHII